MSGAVTLTSAGAHTQPSFATDRVVWHDTGLLVPHDENGSADSISANLIDDVVQVFKILSDETRIKILFQLTRQPEAHVSALCKTLAHSQPAVSHHLALLKSAGLVDVRRDGKHNFYRLAQGRYQSFIKSVFAAAQ